MKKLFYILSFCSCLFFSCNPGNDNPADTPDDQIILEINREDSELSISRGLDLLTIFHYADTFTKPFFFPVNTLEGITVTRGFPYDPRPLEPVDHPHQTGMWFTFGNINQTDFWNNSYAIPEDKRVHFGVIRTDSIAITGNADEPSFFTKCYWIDGKGDTLLVERTTYTFKSKDQFWSMTRETQMEASTGIVFSDNKEGLFAIRVARELQSDTDRKTTILDSMLRPSLKEETTEGKNGYYTGSNGKEASEVWGTSNQWVSLSGEKDGEKVNLVIFDHPENFGFPSYWHARDYGLFSVDNFGRKAFNKDMDPLKLKLDQNEAIHLRHKIFISDTILREEKIRELFNDFIQN